MIRALPAETTVYQAAVLEVKAEVEAEVKTEAEAEAEANAEAEVEEVYVDKNIWCQDREKGASRG